MTTLAYSTPGWYFQAKDKDVNGDIGRLTIYHLGFMQAAQGRLVFAPLDFSTAPRALLDVGTADGLWMRDVQSSVSAPPDGEACGSAGEMAQLKSWYVEIRLSHSSPSDRSAFVAIIQRNRSFNECICAPTILRLILIELEPDWASSTPSIFWRGITRFPFYWYTAGIRSQVQMERQDGTMRLENTKLCTSNIKSIWIMLYKVEALRHRHNQHWTRCSRLTLRSTSSIHSTFSIRLPPRRIEEGFSGGFYGVEIKTMYFNIKMRPGGVDNWTRIKESEQKHDLSSSGTHLGCLGPCQL